jgi:hypothetical protein
MPPSLHAGTSDAVGHFPKSTDHFPDSTDQRAATNALEGMVLERLIFLLVGTTPGISENCIADCVLELHSEGYPHCLGTLRAGGEV